MRLVMVGCGNMGGALLEQWAQLEDLQFCAVSPSGRRACASVVTDIEQLTSAQYDAVIIAVKPQMIDAVMPAYVPRLRSGGVLVSLAAGTTISHLQTLFPTVEVVRMMPNLSAKIGRGVTGLVATVGAEVWQRHLVERLASASGVYQWVQDEDALDRLTAVSGCGSGYAFQMMESFERAAIELGFNTAEAQMLVRETLLGAAEMAASVDTSAEALKQAVMSKRGVTEAGIAQMQAGGAMDLLMQRTVKAAYARAREMADGNHEVR